MASALIRSIVVNGQGKSKKYYDRPIRTVPEVQRIMLGAAGDIPALRDPQLGWPGRA